MRTIGVCVSTLFGTLLAITGAGRVRRFVVPETVGAACWWLGVS
jgi:hypothetical protein